MTTSIIGGGAAGFFLAVNLKELAPEMDITIFEASHRVLSKVEISGGGRCNCTNSFEGISDLQQVYPRGHRLMKRLFNIFDHRDAYRWFESRGVPLVTQADYCVFPRSQDSHTIINLFLSEAQRLGIHVRTDCRIRSLDEVADSDFVVITTGGQPRAEGLQWIGEEVVQPVPSLFTFSIDDERLHQLMGTVVDHATAFIPGTRQRSEGPLLITHWGMSGPCILRLSSYAARTLHDAQYRMPLTVNWLSLHQEEVMDALTTMADDHAQKLLTNVHPQGIQQRLWQYLAERALAQRSRAPWGSLNRKELNRLVNVLTNDSYLIAGRAPFKDEFVTCGGIALQAVNPTTIESKSRPHLYFAGEVLDIDGITGGFNFQAAWTTAFTVAQAISRAYLGRSSS